MHSIEFLEADIIRYIPENMDECNRTQRLDMSKLILMYQMAEINLDQFKVMGLYSLMNMEYSEAETQIEQDEKWQNIYVISQLLESFYEIQEDGSMRIIFEGIDNLVKTVSYKRHTFYGPKDWFKDMKWKQFIDGIGELQKFRNTGKIECLLKLFAIFYLKNNERYSKVKMEKRIEFFNTLDIRYIYHFYLMFNNFWIFLTKYSLISVHGREIDLRILFEKNEDPNAVQIDIEPPDLGFLSTSFQLAESGVFGTMEELDEAESGSVFLRMYDMVVRSKIRAAEQEALENKNK